MQDRKWQYKVVTVKVSAFKNQEKQDADIQDRLTRLAIEGWELVTVAHPYGGHPRFYLRK